MTPELSARIVADSRDHGAWMRARSQGITATDIASVTSERVIPRVAQQKLYGSGFSGNAYTDHGRRREPEIARWVEEQHGILPSSSLFHATNERRHLATPDGVGVDASGRILLAEIKTTKKPWRTIPRGYLRQVWWQQHVLGAERTLFAWEEHDNFRPVHDEPQFIWIERDEVEIARLVALATALIDELYRRTTGQQPPSRNVPATSTPRERALQRASFRALALADDTAPF